MKLSSTLFIITCFFSAEVFAGGVTFDAGLGLPQSQLKNPDGSIAYYSGLAVTAKLHLPVFGGPNSSIDLNLAGRYLDLKNNANSASQDEVANQFGIGPGITANFYRVFIGAEYLFVKERHYWVGETNSKLEASYPVLSYHAGLEFKLFRDITMGLSYQSSAGKLPKKDTGFSEDLVYKDEVYWIHLRLDTKETTGKFFGGLLK